MTKLANPLSDDETYVLEDIVTRRGLPAVLLFLAGLEDGATTAHADGGDAPRAAAHSFAALCLRTLAVHEALSGHAAEADPGWGPGPMLRFFLDPEEGGHGEH